MEWRLSNFIGEIRAKCLPPVVDIPGEDFVVQCAIRAVPQADHQVYEGSLPTPLLVNTMQEGGEDPIGRTGTGLPGADLRAPGRSPVPPRTRNHHH